MFGFDLTNVKNQQEVSNFTMNQQKTLVSMTPHYTDTNELMGGNNIRLLYVYMSLSYVHFIVPIKPSMNKFKGKIPQNHHSFLAVFVC